MNNVEVLIANNTTNLTNECISKVGFFCENLSYENIIIVPDRLSLLTEQKIFEILNIDVYFNISVMGISKFASQIIKNSGLSVIECSNLQAKLLTLKAIQNTKDNFNCFSKSYTLGLVDEIYAKIEQIKSSNASINDLVDPNASIGTKLKFEDLKNIYIEYEKLRAEKLDSGALLSLFNNIAQSSDYLKKCNVFFVGFDSITKQGLEVIKNVIKTAHSTTVGVVAPNNQPNAQIYDQTFLSSIINLCKNEKFESNMHWLNAPLKNKTANNILTYLFSRKTSQLENNYLNIYKATSPLEEIDFVTKSINYLIKTTNAKFKDIAICAPENYHEIISSKLNSIMADFYQDKKTSLANLEPAKYVLHNLKLINDPHDTNSLKQLLLNSFCPLSKNESAELCNLIDKFSSLGTIIKTQTDINENIKNYILNLQKFINDCKNNIKLNNNCESYLKIIEKILNNCSFFEKINDFCQYLESINEIPLSKTYTQIENKFNNIVSQIGNVLANENMPFGEFLEIFEKALTECEISNIPSTTNQIFIGDTKSFYGNIDYLYVLGLNEGITPEVLSDTGLISDKEIASDSIVAKLEPTTSIINKRNKFKTLEVILSAKQKCYLTFHNLSAENKLMQPSAFITELQHILNVKIIDISSLKTFNENKISLETLCFNSVNQYTANLCLRGADLNRTNTIISSALAKNNQLYFKPQATSAPADYKELFLTNNKISSSLVEKYNSCPKSAFLANGIKLQKKQLDKIEANIIGSYIHETAEVFVRVNKNKLGTLTQQEILTSIEKITKDIIKKEEYYSLCLDENCYILKMINKECLRLCLFLNFEQQNSAFKATHVEKYFGANSNFKPLTINVGGEEYYISGIVDRIDEYDDFFRIIDYKTGNTTNAKGISQLFYGTKVQLFLYAEAIRQNLGKKLFGAFYLPIKNGFNSKNQEEYSLSGFFVKNSSLAMHADLCLNSENPKSKLLNCTLNKPDKNGEVALGKKDNIVEPEILNAFSKYAIASTKLTIANLKDGYITCSPIAKKCLLCDFKNCCKFFNLDEIARGEDYNIVNENFLRINYDK